MCVTSGVGGSKEDDDVILLLRLEVEDTPDG
jgi:hypothetical protein